MTVKKWVGTLFILAIPIVNIIFLLIWAFGKENPRKNFSRGALIVYSVTIGLALVLGVFVSILEVNQSQESSYEHDFELEESLKNDLVVSDFSVIEDDMGYKFVTGKVKNNSTTDTYSMFTLEFNIYDGENSIIESSYIGIKDSIPPGEVYRFETDNINSDGFSVKFLEVRESYEWE